MQLPDDGLRLAVFTADVGSRAAEALDLLASWITAPTSSSADSHG